jgi:hypothetical protein
VRGGLFQKVWRCDLARSTVAISGVNFGIGMISSDRTREILELILVYPASTHQLLDRQVVVVVAKFDCGFPAVVGQ